MGFLNKAYLSLGSALVFGLVAPSQAVAATVVCNVHAPLGYYKVELFRVGDPYPTIQKFNEKIDGGKIVYFHGVPTGNWFVRATLEVEDYPLTGQGPSGHITSWFPWNQSLPDCWVNP